jgi:hypothetical protein
MNNNGIVSGGMGRKLDQIDKEYKERLAIVKSKEEIEQLKKWHKEAIKKAKNSWF